LWYRSLLKIWNLGPYLIRAFVIEACLSEYASWKADTGIICKIKHVNAGLIVISPKVNKHGKMATMLIIRKCK
jgi:hypothetical protein